MAFPEDNNSVLMVPIKLDALFVPESGIQVVGPMVDFTKLPYSVQDDGDLRYFNTNEPYISETVLSTPLSDQNFNLGGGIHLHWALPDALTHATFHRKMEFPNVPNRWLVVRKSADPGISDAKWIVLSDYLWPVGTDPSAPNAPEGVIPPVVAYHHQASKKAEVPGQIPFRYLGYVQKGFHDNWELPSTNEADYILNLTSIGYAEPLFAAFYPNCMGVFGIHDAEITSGTDLKNISYEVYGWYGAHQAEDAPTDPPKDDILQRFLTDHEDADPDTVHWLTQLEEELGWTLNYNDGEQTPSQSVYFAKVQFTAASAPTELNVLEGGSSIEVCVGNTNTEALSAYLANKMSADQPGQQRIESQLESLHLSPQLQDKITDLGPAFEEARHTQSFHSLAGGYIWELRMEDARQAGQAQLHDVYRNEEAANLAVPKKLMAQLHELNLLEESYQRSWVIIESLQQRIFSDWQKYMQAVYHDPFEDSLSEDGSPYPDIDAAKAHIEKMMALLHYRKAYTGALLVKDALDEYRSKSFDIPDGTMPFSDLLYLIPAGEQSFETWGLARETNSESVPPPLASSLAEKLGEIQGNITRFNRFGIEFGRIATPLFQSDFDVLDETQMREIAESLNTTPTDLRTQGSLSAEQIRVLAALTDNFLEEEGLEQFPHKLSALIAGLTTSNQQLEALKPALDTLRYWAQLPGLRLQKTAAPRYWEPREPVVLLAGPAAQTTDRHGMDGQESEDGFLQCGRLQREPVEDGGKPIPPLPLKALQDFMDAFAPAALTQTDGSPWHSLFFEWEVRVDPMRKHNNLDQAKNRFSTDFLRAHYNLNDDASEFSIANTGSLDVQEEYFIGRSIMTPFALDKLEYELKQFLIKETQTCLQNQSTSTDPTTAQAVQILLNLAPSDSDYTHQWWAYFQANQQQVIDFHNSVVHAASGSPDGDEVIIASASPIQTAIDAVNQIETLREQNVHIQSQSLGGFNQALLMLHQTYQMEIAEPNGFKEYRAFTDQVRQAVGRNNLYTGMSQGAFHPFRTGQMHINRLRLVDTYGRIYQVIDQTTDPEHLPPIYASQWMTATNAPNAFNLPPRITQPARLHFRWLAADGSDVFASTHPDTMPICGWVIPNRLDGSLMIYAGSGEPLGYIDENGHWRVYPGRTAPLTADDIENEALRKIVHWVIIHAAERDGTADNFMDMFMADLEQIMDDIAPDSAFQHSARSLLVGRPLALVQAAVDIHLRGWPAVHQDMSIFKAMVESGNQPYTDDDFTKVEIAIRIGEQQRLNDGLVGFWMEGDEGLCQMYAPFDLSGSSLQSIERNNITFQQALGAPAQKLTILMDPRGLIHCTTGLLPTESLSLPMQFVAPALEKLQISFLSAPLLSEQRKLTLSLPVEAGFTWAWMQRDGDTWTKLTTRLMLRKADVLSAFEKGEELWELLRQENWIELQEHDPNAAFLNKPIERTGTSPTSLAEALLTNGNQKTWDAVQANIATTLWNLAAGIALPKTTAFFGETTEIREGWLTLTPVEIKPFVPNQ